MPASKTVFLDVDTQADFMLPGGGLYVPGAEKLIPALRRLRDFAAGRGIPIISSMDAHAPDDEEFQQFPPHCVKGTPGQKKISQTLLPQYGIVPNELQPQRGAEESVRHSQWILEKQKFDVFTNMNADALLQKLGAERFVVYGVATEYCVRAAVLGLLQRGYKVDVLTDVIGEIDPARGRAALDEMREKGARLVIAEQIWGNSRDAGYCAEGELIPRVIPRSEFGPFATRIRTSLTDQKILFELYFRYKQN